MNADQSRNRWNDIKKEVRSVWGHITPDEIDAHRGNMSALSELIQEKYDDSPETIIEKLEEILMRFGPTTEDIKNLKNTDPYENQAINHNF